MIRLQRLMAFFLLLAGKALADPLQFELEIKQHLFNPSVLYVPAGQKFRLKVSNLDSTPEEFESFSLNREKVILGRRSAVLYLGPLEVGEYPFFGEFNPDSAQGTLIALPAAEWEKREPKP